MKGSRFCLARLAPPAILWVTTPKPGGRQAAALQNVWRRALRLARSFRLFVVALHRFGHVEACMEGQASAFELDCAVRDLKFVG